MEQPVTGNRLLEHKGLEKPGGVRQMPFDRTRVGHRLQRAILGRQRLRKAFGLTAHLPVMRGKCRGPRVFGANATVIRLA